MDVTCKRMDILLLLLGFALFTVSGNLMSYQDFAFIYI